MHLCCFSSLRLSPWSLNVLSVPYLRHCVCTSSFLGPLNLCHRSLKPSIITLEPQIIVDALRLLLRSPTVSGLESTPRLFYDHGYHFKPTCNFRHLTSHRMHHKRVDSLDASVSMGACTGTGELFGLHDVMDGQDPDI